MGGPQPRPTAIKLLRSERKDRINTNQPQSPQGNDTPPNHLDRTAKDEWRRIVPILTTMRCFTDADRSALAMYCALYSRWQQARAKLKAGELIIAGTNSMWQHSPYIKLENECIDRMLRILEAFGCTPASRSRLTVPDKPESSSLGAFIVGKPRPKKTGT